MHSTHRCVFFLWNDVRREITRWKKAIEQAFSGHATVTPSVDNNVEQIIAAYRLAAPDFVVLDVYDKEGHQNVGLEVAQRIRQLDRFVPIVVVTKYPGELYRDGLSPEGIGLNGVFDRGVMKLANFMRIVFWPVIAECHRRRPEFALLRAIGRGLEPLMADPAAGRHLKELWEGLQKLPYAGDREAWHSQVCRMVGHLLRERQMADVAGTLEATGSLFREADKFYMAGGRSRKHVPHNVQVFLLGLAIMLGDTELREHLDVAPRSLPWSPPPVVILDCVLVWACAALTHDVGYFVQYRRFLDGVTTALDEDFRQMMGGQPRRVPAPIVAAEGLFHAEVGAAIWEKAAASDEVSAQAGRMIAAAIRRHDSSHGSPGPVAAHDWLRFLIVLCDELQDWGREPSDAEPGAGWSAKRENERPLPQRPFEYHGIDRIRTGRDDGVEFIEIGFTAGHFPVVVTTKTGQPGDEEASARLARTGQNLRKQLRARGLFELRLAFSVTSKLDQVADWKTYRLAQEHAAD